MLKKIVILLNLSILGFWIYFIGRELLDSASISFTDFLVILWFWGTPVLTIWVLTLTDKYETPHTLRPKAPKPEMQKPDVQMPIAENPQPPQEQVPPNQRPEIK